MTDAGLEELLPLFQAEVQVDCDEIGEMPWVLGVEGGDFDLLRKRRGELDDLLELALGVAHHGRQLHRIFLHILDELKLGRQVGIRAGIALDLNPPKSLNQHPNRVIREFEHL